ncbi:hypothetical protein BABINDRAFT_160650 [Babjeviella inositovora NRRL Y-12698]|uniref:PIG-P domain-containing protein n=1 Tax=Babjeviella inositovora NRRL Y-12698 TaxID=984486 RepID=A0A1E3QUC0_9ASCO|nr:uncharacterized protein BABINDRAFT_160650 [Babjeviella inositovora NRRL Y-12698]ODQ81281.1 hypothetical protein BABINDRAFT_160650 [Babjeviella inositovora NRRL Y-12698]
MSSPARPSSPFQRLTRTLSSSLLLSRMPQSARRRLFARKYEQAASDALARESDVTVSNKVTPHFEYKGFATFTIATIFFAVWLAWTFVPEAAFHRVGIYYYPSRWWALTIPAYLLMAMLYTYIALALYNIEVATVPLNDLRNIVDESGIMANAGETESTETFEGYGYNDVGVAAADPFVRVSTSGVRDLPISTVNQILYG